MTAKEDCLSRKVAPAYAAISLKLKGNLWRTGAHIKPDVLADHFGISITPIREALQRLAAERMVEFRRGKGYYVRHFDAEDIGECYCVIEALITFSLVAYSWKEKHPRIPPPVPLPEPDAAFQQMADYGARQAEWLEALGLALIAMSENKEMLRIIRLCNARTHVIRVLDCSDRSEGTWVTVALQKGLSRFTQRDVSSVHEMLRYYFKRRVKRLPELAERANRIGQAAPFP